MCSMNNSNDNISKTKSLSGLYENWFLDYASYVILERAVPKQIDGLKPVQRRILHSMKNMDDGRFHKVANIIGQTMQYHPHGDAAIGDALINLGQKDLLIETQGNWGDIRTGDKAAAPRYIEAKLSSFAIDVAFNKNTTTWQSSYDGRKKEPVFLPVKFPLLLAQGVEGIAVGLSTKIMPHNFIELIKASINILKNKPFKIFPDFLTGGIADFSNYNQGKKGGKIRLRSKIEPIDKKTLMVKDVPYSINTTNLIDSIIKANDSGKIKIKKVEDNTAENVEIIIHLAKGISPQITIDALYAFTNCEISISPNCCVIVNNKPEFVSVNHLLKLSTNQTVELLNQELKLLKEALLDKWHISILEKIFIENKIYRKIESSETWEDVIQTISIGLNPYKKQLKRKISTDDILKLTEIKIKRISKFDSNKAIQNIKTIESDLDEVNNNLLHLTDYAIRYFELILKNYSFGKERKTEISTFESISIRRVVVANKKLYINKKEGFIGFNLKQDEFISDCSDIDNIIVFLSNGKYKVVKIDSKVFVGKNIIHAAIWKKQDKHMVYNAIYRSGRIGKSMVKRFSVTSIVRDREYDLTAGDPMSKVLYFTANPNSESEVVSILLDSKSKARNKSFDFNFNDIAIKGRASKGNIISKYPIKKIVQKSIGESTLGGRDFWIDKTIGRLNTNNQGLFLGSFNTDNSILSIYNDGSYEQTFPELSNRYNFNNLLLINKFDKKIIVSCVYYNGKNKSFYIKRFKIETSVKNKRFSFISDERGSKLIAVSLFSSPELNFNYRLLNGSKKSKKILINDFIAVKGWKSIGKKIVGYKKLSAFKIIEVKIDSAITIKEKNNISDSNKRPPDSQKLSLF